jgi:polyisoprenoid-binding protein YceI
MTMKKIVLLSASLLLILSVGAQAKTFQIDPAHSSVDFGVKYMMLSNVSGKFTNFGGSFDYVPGKPGEWSASAEIQAASVDTGNDDRDDHLRSADFFDVEKYPTLTFTSKKVEDHGDGEYKLHGEFTMLDTTLPVVLDLEMVGEIPDPRTGGTRVAWNATGTIDRKAFGMTWSRALDSGGLVVGNDIEFTLAIQGVAE